jgi:tryptophan synthase beta subunit
MELNLTVDEILELFNFMDDKHINLVTQNQFVDTMNSLMTKMGGAGALESSASLATLMRTRKQVPNMQVVFKILSDMCDIIQKK